MSLFTQLVIRFEYNCESMVHLSHQYLLNQRRFVLKSVVKMKFEFILARIFYAEWISSPFSKTLPLYIIYLQNALFLMPQSRFINDDRIRWLIVVWHDYFKYHKFSLNIFIIPKNVYKSISGIKRVAQRSKWEGRVEESVYFMNGSYVDFILQ